MYSPTAHCSPRLDRKRRLSSSSSLHLQSPNNVDNKKSKVHARTKPDLKETPGKNLIQLPLPVLERLLLFLDVSSLEQLSSTCSFLHQLISGCHITSLEFPFSQIFLSELGASNIVEKKPLLRIRSHKTKDDHMPGGNIVEYMVSSQLALLDLTKLRDLLLVPDTDLFPAVPHSLDVCMLFDLFLLRTLSRSGCLRNITRLELVIDRHCDIHYYMHHLPNLLHLGLTIATLKTISSRHLDTFVRYLELAVASCRAPSLAITVLQETRIKTKKVFVNRYVEHLTVIAPCNFNLDLVLENVKDVTVVHPATPCTYHRSPLLDRNLHRPGLCAVSLSSVHQRCPNILTFAGLEVRHVSQQQSFGLWSSKLKSIFYSDYRARGGELQLKAWGRRRWLRKP